MTAEACRRFAAGYLRTFDAEQAAADAGLRDGARLLETEPVRRELERRRAALPERADLIRRLAEIAFGRANDCVKLALDPALDPDALDLSLLTELRRSERGAVEVRLADRLGALQTLLALCPDDGGAADFFAALSGACAEEAGDAPA